MPPLSKAMALMLSKRAARPVPSAYVSSSVPPAMTETHSHCEPSLHPSSVLPVELTKPESQVSTHPLGPHVPLPLVMSGPQLFPQDVKLAHGRHGPPQSTPVSPSSCTPSPQVGLMQAASLG